MTSPWTTLFDGVPMKYEGRAAPSWAVEVRLLYSDEPGTVVWWSEQLEFDLQNDPNDDPFRLQLSYGETDRNQLRGTPDWHPEPDEPLTLWVDDRALHVDDIETVIDLLTSALTQMRASRSEKTN